jgi:hypothetical protein
VIFWLVEVDGQDMVKVRLMDDVWICFCLIYGAPTTQFRFYGTDSGKFKHIKWPLAISQG